VENDAPSKGPTAGLFHSAWKSSKGSLDFHFFRRLGSHFGGCGRARKTPPPLNAFGCSNSGGIAGLSSAQSRRRKIQKRTSGELGTATLRARQSRTRVILEEFYVDFRLVHPNVERNRSRRFSFHSLSPWWSARYSAFGGITIPQSSSQFVWDKTVAAPYLTVWIS